MCNTPKNDAAEIARQQEYQRQARVSEGGRAIDAQLAGFNQDFYDRRGRGVTSYYLPELNRQFDDAKSQIVKNLAASGLTGSSIASDRFGDLENAYTSQRSRIGQMAVDEQNRARSSVEGIRSTLNDQLQSGLDPYGASQRAASMAGNVRATPTYSPLENVFSTLLGTGAQSVRAQSRGFPGIKVGSLFGRSTSPNSREVR